MDASVRCLDPPDLIVRAERARLVARRDQNPCIRQLSIGPNANRIHSENNQLAAGGFKPEGPRKHYGSTRGMGIQARTGSNRGKIYHLAGVRLSASEGRTPLKKAPRSHCGEADVLEAARDQ